MKLRDEAFEKFLEEFQDRQSGMSFSVPSYGVAGQKVFLVQSFHLPMKSTPTVLGFSNPSMTNCSNPVLQAKNRFGFIGFCTRDADGLAYFSVNWVAEV